MSAPVLTLSTTNGQLNLLDCWRVTHSTTSEVLHCECPHCVHLDDVPHDDDARAARGIVKMTVDGATKDVYRFPKGAQIYLASLGSGVPDTPTNKDHNCRNAKDHNCRNGIAFCTECFKAVYEAERDEWWRACVRKMRGNEADTELHGSEANIDFARLPAMEKLNDTLHEEGAKLTELAEFGKDGSRAQDAGGGDDAQRKEEIKRHHAAVLVAKKAAASKAVDKANAETLLARYRNGCTIDPEGKEEDDTVDVGDEDGEKALELHAKCDGNVQMLRDGCPNHALRWFGRAPTEEEIAAQASLVDKLTSESDAAKAEFDEKQGQLKELEKQMVEDLEEEAFGDDAPKPRGKRKPTDVKDMTLDEAVAHEERRRRNAETRRKSAEKRRDMLLKYPELLAQSEKYGEVQKQLEEKTLKLETLKANAATWRDAITTNEARNKEMESQMDAAKTRLDREKAKFEKQKDNYVKLKNFTSAWFEDLEGKPPGWDKNKMFDTFQEFIKAAKEAAKEAANADAGANA